jgi:hypothetical protein
LSSKRTFPVAASMTMAPEYGLRDMISNGVAFATVPKSSRRMSAEMSDRLIFMTMEYMGKLS